MIAAVEVERLAFSPAEVGQALGISRSQVYALQNRGEIPFVIVGGLRLTSRSALEQLVDPSHHAEVVADGVIA